MSENADGRAIGSSEGVKKKTPSQGSRQGDLQKSYFDKMVNEVSNNAFINKSTKLEIDLNVSRPRNRCSPKPTRTTTPARTPATSSASASANAAARRSATRRTLPRSRRAWTRT